MCMYSRISGIWYLHDWRGARLLSIPFIKQYLYWPKFLQEIFPCATYYRRWLTVQSCDIQSENTIFKTLLLSALPTIYIDVADCCVLPLVFLRSLCILSGCRIINICSCHKDLKLSWVGPMEYDPHSGFHYSKLLTYLSYDYSSFINISGMDLGGSEYSQVSNFYLN